MAETLPFPTRVSSPPDTAAGAPLVADAKRLAALLGMGLRTIRSMDAAGKLPKPVRISGRVCWRIDEIRAWLDAGAPDREAWAAIRAARK